MMPINKIKKLFKKIKNFLNTDHHQFLPLFHETEDLFHHFPYGSLIIIPKI